MWTMTYQQAIPTPDLLLRVISSDPHGGAYFVARVRHRHRDGHLVTIADMTPVPPGETRFVVDPAGEPRLADTAGEIDPHGVAQLARLDNRIA